PRLPVSGGAARRGQRAIPQGRRQRDPGPPRARGARCDGVPRSAQGQARARGDGVQLHEPAGQRGLLGWREEAERELADGAARAAPRHPGRDGLGARHRRAQGRGRRHQQAAPPRQRRGAGDALPAHAQLRDAGPRPRARRRPNRALGRAGPGAGARGTGLRLARGRCRSAGRGARMTTETFLSAWKALEASGAFAGPPWLRALRREAIARFAARGLPTTRDEEWKYTSVAPITAVELDAAAEGGGDEPAEETLAPEVLSGAWPRL